MYERRAITVGQGFNNNVSKCAALLHYGADNCAILKESANKCPQTETYRLGFISESYSVINQPLEISDEKHHFTPITTTEPSFAFDPFPHSLFSDKISGPSGSSEGGKIT